MNASPFIPATRQAAPHELQAALQHVPAPWRGRVAKLHAKKTATGPEELRAGNAWLAATIARMGEIRVPISATDADLCAKAREIAAACMGLSEIAPQGGAPKFSDNGAAFAARGKSTRFYLSDLGQIRRRMAGYLDQFGITAPRDDRRTDPATGETEQHGTDDAPAIRRMTDHLWIRRQLRKAQTRALEAEAIRLGFVHRLGEVYASNHTTTRRAQQRARNAEGLAATTARNLDTGDDFTLQQLAEKSTANPVIRRGELMLRLAGFEACAKALGHVGLFITLTCPSRMHAKKSTRPAPGRPVQVFDNPKFDGTTPRQAQAYLCKVWARTRAALARVGAACYGFRIAEPHHDGAPHWHLLLFVARAMRDTLAAIFVRQASREDADELTSIAACQARFLVKRIDPAKGSAAGYLAKYVAKNIDGYQVQRDFSGTKEHPLDAVTTAPRVDAWASAWGIRQFQQIGGAPVGIWRELRRLEAEAVAERGGEVLAAAFAACNKTDAKKADFGAYLAAMGGPLVKRADLPLTLAKTDAGTTWNRTANEAQPTPPNRYGEAKPGAVYGVREWGAWGRNYREHVSVRYTWEIKRGAAPARRDAGKCESSNGAAAPFDFSDRYTWEAKDNGAWGLEAGPASPASWSPVNNCTGVKSGGVEFNDCSESHDPEKRYRPGAEGGIHGAGAGQGNDLKNGRPDGRNCGG